MLRKNPTGHYPDVSAKAFIDPTAIICGRVIIEENVFVGPYAVIRADEVDENGEILPIIIKRDSNIQDGVVIHSKAGAAVTIGERTSIAHRSIIHGPCSVGNDVFIGFNSVIFRTHISPGCVYLFGVGGKLGGGLFVVCYSLPGNRLAGIGLD